MDKEEFNELVKSARETDLLTYFQENNYNIMKTGDNYYIKEIPGF